MVIETLNDERILPLSGVAMANRAGRYAVTRNVDDTRKETISVAGFKALESENLPNNT